MNIYPETPRWSIPTYIGLATKDNPNGANIWTIYLTEAKKYDKALVESWRDNVTGILIFAGLFSAVVTAFIIEAYKTLQTDSADTTNYLLTQISLQLAQISSGSNGTLTASPIPQFTPSKSALACNILWFTSLGLSLCCALIAILVGQWAQDFLHSAERHSAPVVGARIISYLYYGIRRFNMHTMVAIIPLLLHTSLFLFFAGLIAFLIPINVVVMTVSATVFAIFMMIYLVLTVLPLFYLDCPYRTPLSGVLWRIRQIGREWYQRILRDKYLLTRASGNMLVAHSPTFIAAMTHQATADTVERAERDYRAFRWTLKSLLSDEELESFVSQIPSLLQDTKSNHLNPYKGHIRALLHDHEIQLRVRIEGMLRDSREREDSEPEDPSELQSICFQAMWAIAKLYPEAPVLTDTSLIEAAYDPAYKYLSVGLLPLATLTRNRAFAALDVEMIEILRYLGTYDTQLARGRTAHDMKHVESCLVKMRDGDFDYPDVEAIGVLLRTTSWSALWIKSTIDFIRRFCADVPYFMLFRYLTDATRLGSEPQEHEYVCGSFALASDPLAPAVETALETTFNTISAMFSTPFLEGVLRLLVGHWMASPQANRIPFTIIMYLARARADLMLIPSGPFVAMVSQLDRTSLWTTISAALAADSSECAPHMDVMLKLCNLTLFELSKEGKFLPVHTYEPALSAVATLPTSSSSIALTALLKSIILVSFFLSVLPTKEAYLAALEDPQIPDGILLSETAVSIPKDILHDPPDDEALQHQTLSLQNTLFLRCNETSIGILAEFIDSSVKYPSTSAADVIRQLPLRLPLAGKVHTTHQTHLAEAIQHLFQSTLDDNQDLKDEVLTLPLLQEENRGWLDSPEVAEMIVLLKTEQEALHSQLDGKGTRSFGDPAFIPPLTSAGTSLPVDQVGYLPPGFVPLSYRDHADSSSS